MGRLVPILGSLIILAQAPSARAEARQQGDSVLVEGAGSVAEVNLRAGDIANLGFARAAGVPVVLVGDIDRGGVIASLVGTKAVLAAEDAEQIVGFIVNKFRGDAVALWDAVKGDMTNGLGQERAFIVDLKGSVPTIPPSTN